jgi:tetratricopeptide (TPR) repeat protein
MIELKNCPICDKTDWHSLDYLRNWDRWYYTDFREEGEPIGWKICKECGFTSYDMLGDERQRDSYTRQRGVVQANSILTCHRKNKYHHAFLYDYLSNNELKNKKFLDVGCAQGAFLNWLHETFDIDKNNLYGNEFAEDLMTWAKYEYGLNVSSEINKSIKYDFISYYHVLEHVEDITSEIEMIKSILAEDGILYLSIPIFFEELEEKSGMACLDFEEYYHLNHIQCFSRKSFNNYLRKHGFKVLKVDEDLYAYTVLCKRSKVENKIDKENYLDIVDKIEKQKKAIELVNQGKHQEALEIYPLYPDAYVLHALNNENLKDGKKQIEILEKGLELLPNNAKILNQLGKVLMQWDDNTAGKTFYSNNIKKAEKVFLKLLEIKPGLEDSYYFLAHVEGKYKKDYRKAVEYLKKFMEFNPFKFGETIPLISNFWKELYNVEKD